MNNTFFVSLDVQSTVRLINDAVVRGSITGECIDHYGVAAPGGGGFVVLVFEKHYYRAGNRLTLTVTIDDLEGRTRVHSVGGGGGEGLFRFDWGAAKSFANVVADTLEPYRAGS